jgi:DNA-binding NarL/FixJ family response regulator
LTNPSDVRGREPRGELRKRIVKLLLVDDHAVVRSSLRAMLELTTPFEVVGDASNGHQALERMREVKPDVVIMDAHMPVMDGAEATRAIKQRWPDVCVLAFTATGELGRVAPMLRAGATGWMLKGQPREELVASILGSVAGRNPRLGTQGRG